jgi:hypothetical protein
VEFFELLGWDQHLAHLRPQSAWCEVRSVERMGRVDGAFDETSHTVDVRRTAPGEGRYNLRNLGFFFWRLRPYRLLNVPAREAGLGWRFHFSSLGNPAPLFSAWRREGDEAGLATELHVPAPIRRAFFEADLERYRRLDPPRPDSTDLYGLFEPAPPSPLAPNPEASLFVVRNGSPVAPAVDPARMTGWTTVSLTAYDLAAGCVPGAGGPPANGAQERPSVGVEVLEGVAPGVGVAVEGDGGPQLAEDAVAAGERGGVRLVPARPHPHLAGGGVGEVALVAHDGGRRAGGPGDLPVGLPHPGVGPGGRQEPGHVAVAGLADEPGASAPSPAGFS